MHIHLRHLRSLSVWTCITLSLGWSSLIAYILFSYESFDLTRRAIENILLVLLVVFCVFLILGTISSIFIAYILGKKSKNNYINIIPLTLCIPAIISCSKYIIERKNNYKLKNNGNKVTKIIY